VQQEGCISGAFEIKMFHGGIRTQNLLFWWRRR
jgi:hypothetical protein